MSLGLMNPREPLIGQCWVGPLAEELESQGYGRLPEGSWIKMANRTFNARTLA